jgi:hypothetical protein
MRTANGILACTLLAACASQPAPVELRQLNGPDPADTANRTSGPRFNLTNVPPWYPPPSMNGTEAVDIEFSVDGRGHAKDLQQTYAASPEFGAIASSYVRRTSFVVPADWEAKGSQAQRFTIEFQFSTVCPPPRAQPRIHDVLIIATCAQHLPR